MIRRSLLSKSKTNSTETISCRNISTEMIKIIIIKCFFLHAPLWTISCDSIVELCCMCLCSRNRASILTSMTLSWRNTNSRNNNNHTVLLQNFSPMSYTNSCLTFDAFLWLQREKKKEKSVRFLCFYISLLCFFFPFLLKYNCVLPSHIYFGSFDFVLFIFSSSLESSLVLDFPLF